MDNVISLQPRTYQASQQGLNGAKSVTVAPLKYRASILIAEISDGWLNYSADTGLAQSSTMHRASVIRNLGKYLDKEKDRTLSLRLSQPIEIIERITEWEEFLFQKYGPTSDHPRKATLEVKKYIAYYLVSNGLDSAEIQQWVSVGATRTHYYSDSKNPLDEFSNRERLAIEKKCKQIVRAGEHLLEVGNKLMDRGANPDSDAWTTPENLVWTIQRKKEEDFPKYFWRDSFDETIRQKLVSFAPALRKHERVYYGHYGVGLIYPTLFHIRALQTLLTLKAGWTPEEVDAIKLKDVLISDESVRVRTTKNRSSSTRYRELPISKNGNPGWLSGDILLRSVDAMSNIDRAKLNSEYFWVGAITSKPLRLSGFLRVPGQAPQYSFSRLVSKAAIDISRPFDRRRLRKTHKSAKATLLGTLSGSAGGDHSVEVFHRHYAQTTTIHTVSAATVIRSQDFVFNKIGPSFIDSTASELDKSVLPSKLHGVVSATKDETETDRQLSVTACADPENPPHGGKSMCFDAPRLCLECSNAVIFKEHIPRIRAYRKVLMKLEQSMTPKQFSALYGQQLMNIDAIISQAGGSSAEESPIKVPLTMKEAN